MKSIKKWCSKKNNLFKTILTFSGAFIVALNFVSLNDIEAYEKVSDLENKIFIEESINSQLEELNKETKKIIPTFESISLQTTEDAYRSLEKLFEYREFLNNLYTYDTNNKYKYIYKKISDVSKQVSRIIMLAHQGANGVYTDEDRMQIQQEVDTILKGIHTTLYEADKVNEHNNIYLKLIISSFYKNLVIKNMNTYIYMILLVLILLSITGLILSEETKDNPVKINKRTLTRNKRF